MKMIGAPKILKLKESDWLQKYIDFNTGKRKNALNSYGKDFFKLMNNSIYGKTMEHLRKRVNIRLVDNAKDYEKWVSRHSFVSQKIFGRNFVAIHRIKSVLTSNEPIYVGFSILDLSKLLMYDFQYNC